MKVTIEIYPKEIKKLLELLDLIDKKPEYIYKGDSSKSQEPIPITDCEVKKSADPYFRKISDKPYESVKYNRKEHLPNKELDQSAQEIVNDLSGKEKLPEASNYNELEELVNDNSTNSGKCATDEEKYEKFKKSVGSSLDKIKCLLNSEITQDSIRERLGLAGNDKKDSNDEENTNTYYFSDLPDDIDKDKFDEFVKLIKQECEERHNTNDDSSTIKSDIPFHENVFNDDNEQSKKAIEKLFDEVFGTDNTDNTKD